MNLETIEPGLDFVKVLDEHASTCDVLLAISDRVGQTPSAQRVRRLNDPNDFVRLELGSALTHSVAERAGFEPAIPLRVCRISSAVLSTTQPPLRRV